MVFAALFVAAPARAQQDTDALVRRGEAAGIEENLIRAVDERARERGLEGAQRAEILAMGVDLAEQGLPADAVLQKALEGLAKQIPTARLVPVLSTMQQQTVEAGRIIRTWIRQPATQRVLADVPPDDEGAAHVLVENLAEALVHDVPRPTIDALLDRLPEEARRSDITAGEVGTAVGVLADLPSSTDDPEATVRLLVSALNAGYSPAEIRSLPLALRAAEQRGVSAADAAAEVARAMTRGTPAEDVLRGLFGGETPGPGAAPGDGSRPGGPPSSVGPPPGVGPDDARRGRGRDAENRGRDRGRDN